MKIKFLISATLITILAISGLIFYFSKDKNIDVTNSVKNEENEQVLNNVKWIDYNNTELGFSMKFPEEVFGLYKCSSPKKFIVPLKVFEDNQNGVIYLTPEYYYRAEWNKESQEYVGPCEKITYSLPLLRNEIEERHIDKLSLGWAIAIKSIKEESEIDAFVKEVYGPGCSAGHKTSWLQSGVYEISVSADGTDLGNTTCLIGWMSSKKVLYSPEKGKLISVILGQECTFSTDYNEPKSYRCYDQEIINSFKL